MEKANYFLLSPRSSLCWQPQVFKIVVRFKEPPTGMPDFQALLSFILIYFRALENSFLMLLTRLTSYA